MKKSTVPQRLAKLGKLFEERHKVYGKDYEYVGQILSAMFPEGLILSRPEDFRRFYMFVFLLSKINRYSQCLGRGTGHKDSLDDLAVYAQMLAELDEE
jgi:hypothetical protein